jgi:very-short-patch-repair endonuclease/DNA polymerase III delta prime subunit
MLANEISDVLRVGKNRLIQIFQYLEALDQRRNPAKSQIKDQPWCYWLRDLPSHPCIQICPGLPSSNTKEDPDFLLKVRRPTLTPAPTPPKQIEDWVKPGWKDINSKPEVSETRNEAEEGQGTEIVRFDSDSQRVEKLGEWKLKWEQWQTNERPSFAAMKVFERLYGLYGDLDRESERLELVLGDGILGWKLESGAIHHPLLLIRVQLEFDPQIPEFTLVETERPVEFYSALFRQHPSVDAQRIGKLREEIDAGAFHPLGGDDTSGFFTRLARTLSANGEFIGQGEPVPNNPEPSIGREPVLFVRTRTLGYATALDAIIQTLKSSDEEELTLPPCLLNIVGVETPVQEQDLENEASFIHANEDESILLSKPANPEQLQIARRLEKYGSVLVQGPPGTGKTHTIANLIGHLLAQGKSILVTSHTTKALSVLRDQVVRELQPLCVSSLENDNQSRQQLEFSINSIVEKLSSTDINHLKRDISSYSSKRSELLSQLALTRQRLLKARTNEYQPIVVGGEGIHPTNAAKKVAAGIGKHDWIPSPIQLGSSLPLSSKELTELYTTNSIITPEDEEAYAFELLNTDLLMEPYEFEQLVRDHEHLSSEIKNQYDHLWLGKAEEQQSEPLYELLKKVVQSTEVFKELPQWKLAAMEVGQLGNEHRLPWDNLICQVEELYKKSITLQEAFLNFNPELDAARDFSQQKLLLQEIVQHLESGNKLNWLAFLLHKTWKEFILALKVNQKAPTSLDEFKILLSKAEYELDKVALIERWDRQIVPLEGPSAKSMGTSTEVVLNQYVPVIKEHLDWFHATWLPLQNELDKAGFCWQALWEQTPPLLKQYGELFRLQVSLAKLPDIFEERISHIRKLNLEKAMKALDYQLNSTEGRDLSPIAGDLKEAIVTRNTVQYRELYNSILRLHRNKPVYDTRIALLSRLEPFATGWHSTLSLRSGVHAAHELPGDTNEAWLWRQWSDELDARNKVSIDDIQVEIENLSNELKQTTTKLIEVKAWAAQVERTNLEQRQSLQGWLQTIERIGKGTGKRVPRLLAEARKLMQRSKTAVPVWIMPMSKVVESFDFYSTKFDVVIIDEASQSDVMGLIAFSLGKQVVIVGDHKQVSPLDVGQKIETVERLIDEFLEGIPNYHLYDGKASVYDLAQRSFSGLICLKEHFRCVPEIIHFSNLLSYNGEIKPLRDSALADIKPNVIAYQVSDAFSENKLNKKEAYTVASLVKACINRPEYRNKTFGVISLLGAEQAAFIDNVLKTQIEPAEYERYKIRCGIPAVFQGDERHIVFLSVVDGLTEGTHALRETDLYKKRFNVAASRAKDQLWVVHSLQPDIHLKPNDLRRRLIDYAQNPSEFIRQLEDAETKTESEFEKQVYRRLISEGYKVTPQWKVGYYRIDMVVEGNGKRIALECDGEKYHPPEKLSEDLARQAILERMNWKFIRIRGSEYFRSPEKAMDKVFLKLREAEVYPTSHGEATLKEELPSQNLEEIYQEAQIILKQWQEEPTEADSPSSIALAEAQEEEVSV